MRTAETRIPPLRGGSPRRRGPGEPGRRCSRRTGGSGPGRPDVPLQEVGEASRGSEAPQNQGDLPLHADCGFEGCNQKKLVYSNYFICEFCGGFFCGNHRHVFHHNCPNIDEWKKRSSPSPVIGFIKGPWKEPKVIINPQKRRFPQGDRDTTAGDARTGDESAIDDSTMDLPGYQ